VNPLNNPTAIGVDNVLIYIFGISLLMLVGITATMIYFVIKYRRSKYPEATSEAHGSFWLEIIWTALPTLIVMTMFWYGWVNYLGLRNVPEGALEIKCTARQWSWLFEYPDGRKSDKLYVPVGRPVKVDLVSVDVLHSFFVPGFRIKRDVVPGLKSYVWFKATEPGSYDVFCAEYCGTGHSKMITTVEALSTEDYASWAQPVAATAEPRGLTVLKEKGCTACHSLDGSAGIGPSLYQLSGHEIEVMSGGKERELKIDADYLRRSIREPAADIVEGFQPIMPTFGADQLSEEDLQAIVDYLLGKTAAEQPKADGNKLLQQFGCLGCHTLDGSKLVGPTFKGLAGSEVEIKRDDKELKVKVDEDYLRRSIRKPAVDVVEGFPPIMPTFGEDQVSDADLQVIVDFLLGKSAVEKPKLDGGKLLQQYGCLGCHSTDGSKLVGPTFKGLAGSEVEITRGGKEMKVKVDADYLRRSILAPKADIVEGFPPVMPAGDYLSTEEVDAIVEYLLQQRAEETNEQTDHK